MKTFSSNLSFKELCGYGMPISTMFTNGILKADESGTTKIQAPDNAMYNGTSFKTLVAFGLVSEGASKPNAIAFSEGEDVYLIKRTPSEDRGGDYPFAWRIDESGFYYTNTETPVVDPTGSMMQEDNGFPILGWLKGDGSSFEWDGESINVPSNIVNLDSIEFEGRHFWKVDFRNNPLLLRIISVHYGDIPTEAVWVAYYGLEGEGLSDLSMIFLYKEEGVSKLELYEI